MDIFEDYMEMKKIMIFLVNVQFKEMSGAPLKDENLAVLCMMAVRKDCGLKNPDNQIDVGRLKSEVQDSNSLILRSRSAYQPDKPFREA